MTCIESPRFPDNISKGSKGGPNYKTKIIAYPNGRETRMPAWAYGRHSYDAAFGVKTVPLFEQLNDFFHVAWGMTNTFRVKDWRDYKSCSVLSTPTDTDQVIGTGDSTDGSDGTATWQLIKTYTVGGHPRVRPIWKPVADTVLIAVSEVRFTEGLHYNIDYTTGELTFMAGYVPLAGEEITAGFEFDVHCRFDTDFLESDYETYRIGTATVPLIEVKVET